MRHIDVCLNEPQVEMVILKGNEEAGYTAWISFKGGWMETCFAHTTEDLNEMICDKVEEVCYGMG